MSPVIDSHVHHYPEELIKDPGSWADLHGEVYWRRLVVGERERASIQGWASTSKLLEDMQAAGIDKVVFQGWYWEHQNTCRVQNDWYMKCYKEHSTQIIPFACVQPRDGIRALDDLKLAYDEGACGVGEVFPEVQGFSMEDPIWLKIVEWAIEKELPITMHVTEPVGHDYLGRVESPLSEYLWLAQRYPELKLILSHWGGLLPFYEFNPVVRKVFKNVSYDTSASPLLYDTKIYRAVIDVVGADRILFGSDYPLRVFPKKQKEPDFVNCVWEVREAGLNEEEYEKIMGLNFATLLGR